MTCRGFSLATCPPTTNFQGVRRCSVICPLEEPCAHRHVRCRVRPSNSVRRAHSSGLNLLGGGRFQVRFRPRLIIRVDPCWHGRDPREARYPRAIDFECGFQSFSPSGTRCRARRVLATSRSSCARRKLGHLHNGFLVCRVETDRGTVSTIEDNFGPEICGTIKNMLQTSARLLRLLSLFQAQRYWSGVELSQRLDVTRTNLATGRRPAA